MLVLSMLLMGVGTFCVGLLPTYQQIGMWAPLTRVVLRLVQAVGLGGEWGSAALMVAEQAPPRWRGLFGSLTQLGNPVGRRTLYLIGSAFGIVGAFLAFWLLETRDPNNVLWTIVAGICLGQGMVFASARELSAGAVQRQGTQRRHILRLPSRRRDRRWRHARNRDRTRPIGRCDVAGVLVLR
jgi:MFS family permease